MECVLFAYVVRTEFKTECEEGGEVDMIGGTVEDMEEAKRGAVLLSIKVIVSYYSTSR